VRIVLIGSVEFSKSMLERLIEKCANVVGVCTAKQTGAQNDGIDLSAVCQSNDIPWIYADDVNAPSVISWISSKSPDIIFCFGWSRLLRVTLLNLPKNGVIGFHPTALPKNRGRHPIIWSLVLGLEETAATFFWMDEGADSGDILSQRSIVISKDDTARSLYDKIKATALSQLDDFLPALIAGKFNKNKQNELQSNTWRKRYPSDGEIDWRMSAESIYNLVRGLTRPYVGAHFVYDGCEVKVWAAVICVDSVGNNIEPGKVLDISNDGLLVKCGIGALYIRETDLPLENIRVGAYL
jgi:methionyl-tRNA formyltransferase